MIKKQYLSKKKQAEIIKRFKAGQKVKDISNVLEEPTKIVSDFLEENGYKTKKNMLMRCMGIYN